MAERIKSKDGTRETEEILGEKPEDMEPAPDAQGRKGGEGLCFSHISTTHETLKFTP